MGSGTPKRDSPLHPASVHRPEARAEAERVAKTTHRSGMKSIRDKADQRRDTTPRAGRPARFILEARQRNRILALCPLLEACRPARTLLAAADFGGTLTGQRGCQPRVIS